MAKKKKKQDWEGPSRKLMIEVARQMNQHLETPIKTVAVSSEVLWECIKEESDSIYKEDEFDDIVIDDEAHTLHGFFTDNDLEYGSEEGGDVDGPVVEKHIEEEKEKPKKKKASKKGVKKKQVKTKNPPEKTIEKATNMTAPAFNKSFIDYMRMIENDEINPNPPFQRKSGIWKKGDNTNFIKTLLAGLPIPEFYIGEIDEEICLFDGLQRTTALWDWYSGDLPGTIKQYKNLSESELKIVNSFPFVFRDCGKIKEEVAEEIFTKLNATSYSLNKIEILNAAFSGEFISTAQELVKNKIFSSFNLFPENQIKRMLDVEYVLILMSTYQDNYFAGSAPIKKFVKDFDSEYQNKDTFIDKFEKVSKLILSCDLKKGSIWTKKAALFSLISELMFSYTLPKKVSLSAKLDKFELNMETDVKNESIVSEYYVFNQNIIQSTSSKGARVQRGITIQKHIL